MEKNKDDKAELYRDIGLRMKKARLQLGYNQENVAELLGISTAYYGKLERGLYGPSLYRLKDISEVLNMNIHFLITGKEVTNNIPKVFFDCPKKRRYCCDKLVEYALILANDGNGEIN